MSPDRRLVLAGMGVLAAAVAGGVAFEAVRLWGKHYPPTPYDDLLDRLADRPAAETVGRAFLAQHPNFTAATAAAALRARIGKQQFAGMLQQEIAAGHITAAGRWIMPETLVGLCALAAKSAPASIS
jgi:hypothetical protein